MPYPSDASTCASDIGAGHVLFERGQMTQIFEEERGFASLNSQLPAETWVKDNVMRNGLSVHILSHEYLNVWVFGLCFWIELILEKF